MSISSIAVVLLASLVLPIASVSLSCNIGITWTYTGESCLLISTGAITSQSCQWASADSCVTESYTQQINSGCTLYYVGAACGTKDVDDCAAAQTSFDHMSDGSDFACESCGFNNCNSAQALVVATSDSGQRLTSSSWVLWVATALVIVHFLR
mmetsp:Transcript_7780/g.17068  ORF Transcript_7780/g.17068 Transcript_7780/m.17068 type:complete len:153 (+) Transcript_7780:76-534(+)|eukprot:CAMPEP_0178419888 /NCGR_PEP_ID=MMETSP0689_2-20121128/25844_1 /TAXON_ID=160604 /ORGANISM="Amphidinium massartii, Strain CS-259" /LENGTH=152 /DNA_ID=CAMNT_0020041343 /DNA_START=11 /DNA_END=469 /DNA_ORIENTATION=+